MSYLRREVRSARRSLSAERGCEAQQPPSSLAGRIYVPRVVGLWPSWWLYGLLRTWEMAKVIDYFLFFVPFLADELVEGWMWKNVYLECWCFRLRPARWGHRRASFCFIRECRAPCCWARRSGRGWGWACWTSIIYQFYLIQENKARQMSVIWIGWRYPEQGK